MRSVQVGVPKPVLVARLFVVFTVHIAKKVVHTLKVDTRLLIYNTRQTSSSSSWRLSKLAFVATPSGLPTLYPLEGLVAPKNDGN